ncbi:MAG TPA: glycosyltransferase [Gemmatimonadaceae bacterium]|nr:glycosyltransferase [Gemmatimonadaceae bacterium]
MLQSAKLRFDVPIPPRPIVVFGDDWGRHVSTTQHIFRRLSQAHPVVWLNAINHRTPKLSLYDARRAVGKVMQMARSRSAGKDAEPVHSAASEADAAAPARIIPPRILPWHNVGLVRRLNTHSLLKDIRNALTETSSASRPVLVTATPAIPDVVRRLDACVKIYLCLDDYSEIQGVDKDLVLPLEHETLGAVDAVVATAKSLLATKRASSGRGFYLPQGVNYDHFATRQPLPPDLAAIPRPRIGFAGDLALRCDLDLLRDLALSHPEWSVVLVGPINVDVSSLALPNIHILGNRPYRDLPAYVQGFDVGIVPYLLNAWTRAVDPLKTLEYLAAGIPVVSLALPEIYKYSPPVRVARGHKEFIDAVQNALAEPATAVAARRALAREHTWERRASSFMQIIQDLEAACAS